MNMTMNNSILQNEHGSAQKNILIIFDWDDTLFPTYWLFDNKIKLDNGRDVKNYLLYFKELDNLLLTLFKKATTLGQVIIITNANRSWLEQTVNSLPQTNLFIRKYIHVLSARDMYQDTYNIQDWKIMAFNYDIYKYVSWAKHILSIGDAEYEHNALISLANTNYQDKYLKLIRFVPNPSFDLILDQLKSIIKALPYICQKKSHLDLNFL